MVSELFFIPQKCSLSCCSLVSLMSWHACYIGVEPWTFEQKLGEAVFIPAGCPHQVRNLKVRELDQPFFSFYLNVAIVIPLHKN